MIPAPVVIQLGRVLCPPDDVSNRDVYTGIQEDVVYRFNQAGLVDGYPTTLQALYPGAPSGAQAVFTVPETSATYFIKG